MLKFACKDVGVDCDFVANGATVEEVKEKAFAHAGVVHAEILNSMTAEQLAELTEAVEANIQPAGVSMIQITEINGLNVPELLEFKNSCRQDQAKADRHPVVVAHWVGGSRSRVEFKDKVVHIGGDDELNPMQMLHATLAACDVDLVAVHASLLGLKIESLTVEAKGHFNVQSYLGLEGAPGSGYAAISYTVRLSVPGATPEQMAHLRERCERSSPVGDSLTRAIPLKLEFDVSR